VHAFTRTSGLRDSTEYNNLVARRIKEGQVIIAEAREHLGRSSFEVEKDLLEGLAAKAIFLLLPYASPI